MARGIGRRAAPGPNLLPVARCPASIRGRPAPAGDTDRGPTGDDESKPDRTNDMDKGARFYRCDFQVHSPRDCNWKGDRPQTDEARNAYARGFIAACRLRGLDAVAITDHHDVCFF